MEQATARGIAVSFVIAKEVELGGPLGLIEEATQQIAEGWAFYYQSQAWLASRDAADMLVGHGPVVILDDGTVLEGGSLDRRPSDVIKRRAAQN